GVILAVFHGHGLVDIDRNDCAFGFRNAGDAPGPKSETRHVVRNADEVAARAAEIVKIRPETELFPPQAQLGKMETAVTPREVAIRDAGKLQILIILGAVFVVTVVENRAEVGAVALFGIIEPDIERVRDDGKGDFPLEAP